MPEAARLQTCDAQRHAAVLAQIEKELKVVLPDEGAAAVKSFDELETLGGRMGGSAGLSHDDMSSRCRSAPNKSAADVQRQLGLVGQASHAATRSLFHNSDTPAGLLPRLQRGFFPRS